MIVFDLDGTLSNHAWRRRLYLDGTDKDWHRYNEAAQKDDPVPGMATLFWRCCMGAGARAEIWTGRPERYREATEAWLTENLFNGNDMWRRGGILKVPLRMRQEGDLRSSVEIKREWLRAAPEFVTLAIDDREDVVRMFEQEGVTCLIVPQKS